MWPGLSRRSGTLAPWLHRLVEGGDAEGRLTLTMNGTQVVRRPDDSTNDLDQPDDAR